MTALTHTDPAMDQIEFGVATTLEDLVETFRIRACAFVSEQDCPMEDEFDGNDYSGTHIIARKNGKIVAVTRLRYFARFVKAERTAILKGHRDLRLFIGLLKYVNAYVESKGFEEVYTQADVRMQKVYGRFGFRIIGNGEPVRHFGSEYIAMSRRTSVREDAINIRSAAAVLNSIEGSWMHHGVS